MFVFSEQDSDILVLEEFQVNKMGYSRGESLQAWIGGGGCESNFSSGIVVIDNAAFILTQF